MTLQIGDKMNKNKEKVPKIRFPGFTEPWEQRKLGELSNSFEYGLNAAATEFDGKNKYIRITDINDESRDFMDDDLTSPDIDLSNADKYKLSRGDILFARTGASVGKTYIYKECDGLVYYAGFLIRAKIREEYNPGFIFQNTLTKDYEKYISITSQRSGQPGVNAQEYSEYKIMVPNRAEQDKISAYFRSIDNLITLHQRKLNHLKDKKKGLLQKMFPKNGELVPELRFPEFTDHWEQRKFDEIFTMLQNNALSRADLNSEQGSAMNVHYGDILIKFGECLDVRKEKIPFITDDTCLTKYKESFLVNGDVIIADAAEDEAVGKCSEIVGLTTETVISGLHTIPCRANKVFANGYLGYYMNSNAYHNQLLPLIQGTKVSSISKTALKDTIVLYPKSTEEQALISQYFTKLNNLITLHQRKLDHLKEQKKALLQQMFI